MKTYKYIGLVATALMMGACSDGALVEDVVNTPNVGGETVDMTAEVVTELDMQPEENADGSVVPQTKTVMDAGQVTSWSNGDQISVSDGTLMYKYEVENANGASCTFTVVDGEKSIDHDGFKNDFNGCYPAAAVKGWNGTTVIAQVYAEQNYAENIDGGCFGAYMMTQGTVADNHISFKFKHAASVLEVNLATLGVTPKAVYLKANSGVAIAGQIKCDASNNNITVVTNDASTYAPNSQSDVIALTNIASDATIARFYLLPVKLVGGVTVTVVDADGNYYTKKTTTDIGNDAEFTVTNNINSVLSAYQVKPGATTAAKPFYKKVNFGTAASATRKGNWMATIPSNVYYSMLSAPGTHDAATSGCTQYTTYTRCQGSTIAEQLVQGIRVFDLRPGYKYNSEITADNLYIYHGAYSSNVKYVDAMQTIADFLAANPTEAVTIVQVKEEGSGTDRSNEMWNVINAWQDSHVDLFLAADHSNWALNDMRGKIMLLNRNNTATHKGQNIGPWSDKCNVIDWSSNIGTLYYENNEWVVRGTCNANIQDAYEDSQTNKKTKVTQHLNLMSQNETKGRFCFNFLSIAGGVGSNSDSNAQAMNPYATSELANINGPVGYIMADYVNTTQYGVPLVKAIINQNYKYIFKGRTRNVKAPTGGIGIDIAGDDKADEGEVFARKEKNM